MKYFKKYFSYILIFFLFVVGFLLLYFSYLNQNQAYLKVIFFDIGQGDAIYIEAPNGKQMLIDGGAGNNILPNLIKIMPPFDRSIDVVVVTNPDLDHIGGLVSILKNYEVGFILEPGTNPKTIIYENLQKEIIDNNVNKKIVRRGDRIVLDQKENIYLDILFPDQDVSSWENNDGSMVGKLVYDNISFMLMGDATKYTENLIIWNEKEEVLQADVLKLGHHGSHTSSSLLWLEKVKPRIAIISAGKNNRYGHPHQDVLENLKSLSIPYLTTYEEGNIIFETDGNILVASD